MDDPETAGKRQGVMVVDDDLQVLSMITIMMEKIGFAPISCRSMKEALDAFGKNRDGIRLVITDYSLPDGNGKELIARIREKEPAVKFVVASGFREGDTAIGSQKGEVRYCDAFLEKPYTFSELKKLVASYMDEG